MRRLEEKSLESYGGQNCLSVRDVYRHSMMSRMGFHMFQEKLKGRNKNGKIFVTDKAL